MSNSDFGFVLGVLIGAVVWLPWEIYRHFWYKDVITHNSANKGE